MLRRYDAAAVTHDMDLGSAGSPITPHLPDLLHPAGMVPRRTVFLVQYLEQRIQPLVDVVERFAQFTPAVGTMLRAGGHGKTIPG